MKPHYIPTEELRRKAWTAGQLYEGTGLAKYLAEERTCRAEITRRHVVGHCDLCGTDPDADGHCECTGTVVGGDVVLENAWTEGERANA